MSSIAASKNPAYAELCWRLKEAATVGSIASLLGWDQETYMPPAGGSARADQKALISALAHEKLTHPRIAELLDTCEADKSLTGDPHSIDAANLREIRREYDLHVKLPVALVSELARVGSHGQEAWKHARQTDNFSLFAPWLEKMIDLTQQKSHCYAPHAKDQYNALLDEYEPGVTAEQVQAIFEPLGRRLADLVKGLAGAGKGPSDKILHASLTEAAQHKLGQVVLAAMGFDFESGRLDVTTHPFCSGIGPGDTRLTTRYREQHFTDALYSTMHEGGHGLYDQGLPMHSKDPEENKFGQPLGKAISLGIHESQSRMWENFVGRSREFCSWLFPMVQQAGRNGGKTGSLDGFTEKDLYGAVNIVRPSLIRVEADEATYNLHVMIRFAIERRLISGELTVKDLPGEWNALYKQYLGVNVPSNAQGCLQDVHWSFGLIGYFPTYTLGNLYAAQLWETINQQIPNLSELMSKGDFLPLKKWLNTNVHAHGQRYRAAELCQKLTGKALSADPLLRHLEKKLVPLYS